MKIYILSTLMILISMQNFQTVGSRSVLSGIPDQPRLLEVSADASSGDPCEGHGQTVGFGKTWDIATCKSSCSSGLGFRCGGVSYVRCSDGAIIVTGVRQGGCPDKVMMESRQISSNISFYDNNTLKIKFLSALPEEENGNDIFEVEGDIIVEIPEFLLIGGVHYESFTLLDGNYTIDRDDGEFGTVTVRMALNNL